MSGDRWQGEAGVSGQETGYRGKWLREEGSSEGRWHNRTDGNEQVIEEIALGTTQFRK
jgi:hypothetical protein